MALGGPQLSVDLSSVDPWLLRPLVGRLLVGEDLHTWLWCSGLHRDHQDGQVGWSVLWCRCSGDGDNRGYHVAPLGVRESRAPLCAQGDTAHIRGILEGSVQRWRPTVQHPYENGA
jgi:hypothetical protein